MTNMVRNSQPKKTTPKNDLIEVISNKEGTTGPRINLALRDIKGRCTLRAETCADRRFRVPKKREKTFAFSEKIILCRSCFYLVVDVLSPQPRQKDEKLT